MSDFFLRTEDINLDEIESYFVRTNTDNAIVAELKGRTPAIVVGSRGVGKSFLLRIAQLELQRDFEADRVLPVYVSFTAGTLIQSSDPLRFRSWMLAKLCSQISRSLGKLGISIKPTKGISVLAGGALSVPPAKSQLESVAESFENSWRNPGTEVDTSSVPSSDDFREAVEDICQELNIRRVVLLMDEAAHVFIPEQQRQFFTLFRDLRCPHISCKAAIYPGVTSFGDVFQPTHDATFLSLTRDIMSPDYVPNMREIVERQADSSTIKAIERNGERFAVIAYAATGNPRILLRTFMVAKDLNSHQINELIRKYYRTDIWTEHSDLAEKYLGHQRIIDWGREFIENTVLPDLKAKNASYSASERATCFFWINRGAPATVQDGLRILAYTGIVSEHSRGIKATRGEIGVRYQVNLGCLFAQDSNPVQGSFELARNLDVRRMAEYGQKHPAFASIAELNPAVSEGMIPDVLNRQLLKPIDVLDLTSWQKSTLRDLKLPTIGDVLRATEEQLMQAYYVGEKRSRQMRNTAMAAVLEYLSG